jgi:hypothetical protein
MPAKLKYFDARTDSVATVVAAVKEDGACVVTNLISAEVADSIVAEMQPYMDRTSKGRDNFSGLQTIRGGIGSGRVFRRTISYVPFVSVICS